MPRALAVTSLLLLAALGARAQDAPPPRAAGLTVDARLGLTDSTTDLPVGWAPVSVVLANPGLARRVEVEVAITATGGQPWRCRREVALSQGQRWRGWFFVPIPGEGGVVDVTLWPTIADRPEGQPVEPLARAPTISFTAGQGTWRRAPAAAHVVAVGERLDPTDVSWLLGGLRSRWSAPDVELGLRAPDALPDRPEGYATVQLVVLRDVDLAGLSPAQHDALLAWVERGGRVVLVPGLRSAWFRDPLVQRLLGDAQVVPREVERLVGLEAAYGTLATPFGERERFVVYEVQEGPATRLQPVQEVAAVSERLPGGGTFRTITRLACGRGRVDVLAADPARPPFLTWSGRSRFGADLRDALVSEGARAGDDPRADARVLANLGVRRLPARGLVVVLVVAFVVLVGPVNYMLLRRRDAQMLLVVTVPLISLAWTALVFVTGYVTKGLATITRAATLIEVDLGARAAREETGVALTAAGDGEYEVAFGPGLLVTRTAAENGAPTAQDVRLDDDGARLVVRLGPWTQAAFRAERTRLLPGGVSLARVNGALELTNGTDLTLLAAVAHDPVDGRPARLEAPLAPGGRARLAPTVLEQARGGRRALAIALVPEEGPVREVVGRSLDLWKVDLTPGPVATLVAVVEPPHRVAVDGRAADVEVALLHARGRAP